MILEEFLTTAEENGLYLYSDEYLAQILAVLYVYGGSNELFVLDSRLNCITKLAQKRFKLYGGETPVKTDLINKYVKELSNEDNPPLWFKEISKKYKLVTSW